MRSLTIGKILCAFYVFFTFKVYALDVLVKQGDTLSKLLESMNCHPIYGKKGTLQVVVSKNISSIKLKGNLIYVNSKIKIPPQLCSPKKRNSSNLSNSKDIDMTYVKQNTDVDSPKINDSDFKIEDSYWKLFINANIYWIKISTSVNDEFLVSDVVALSKAVPGIGLRYGLDWGRNGLYTNYEFSKVEFYNDRRFEIVNRSFSRNKIFLSYNEKLNPTSAFEMALGFFDEMTMFVPDSGHVRIENVRTPQVHINYSTLFSSYKMTDIKGLIGAHYILPQELGGVKLKNGFGVTGNLILSHKGKNIDFFYKIKEINTSNGKSNSYEIGWELIFQRDNL